MLQISGDGQLKEEIVPIWAAVEFRWQNAAIPVKILRARCTKPPDAFQAHIQNDAFCSGIRRFRFQTGAWGWNCSMNLVTYAAKI